MARPLKNGLDYFPFDVDFFGDEKIAAISGEFGIKGEITAIKLLCAIYRNGYYIEWNDMLKMKLLKDLPGITVTLLDAIVSRLVRWGFFDGTLFDSAAVLTSEGIQRRYFAIAKRRRGTEYPYVVSRGFGRPDGNTSWRPDTDEPSFAERPVNGRVEAEERVSACNNVVSVCNNPVSDGLLQAKTHQIKEKEIKDSVKDDVLKEKKLKKENPEAEGPAAGAALVSGTVSVAPTRMRHVKEIAEELVNEEAWMEQLCVTFGLDKDRLRAKILEFPRFVEMTGERTMRTVSDFKRFFYYHLRKHLSNNNGNSATGNREAGREPDKPADDPYAAHRRRYGLD